MRCATPQTMMTAMMTAENNIPKEPDITPNYKACELYIIKAQTNAGVPRSSHGIATVGICCDRETFIQTVRAHLETHPYLKGNTDVQMAGDLMPGIPVSQMWMAATKTHCMTHGSVQVKYVAIPYLVNLLKRDQLVQPESPPSPTAP